MAAITRFTTAKTGELCSSVGLHFGYITALNIYKHHQSKENPKVPFVINFIQRRRTLRTFQKRLDFLKPRF